MISNKNTLLSCSHCGKQYKQRNALNRHAVLCQVTSKLLKGKSVDLLDELPSQREMYNLLIEVTNKCNYLEKKLVDIQKQIPSKSKKINVIEWLKINKTLNDNFENISIQTYMPNYDFILNNKFMEIITNLFSNVKEKYNKESIPLFACKEMRNKMYIKHENEWKLIQQSFIQSFVLRIHAECVKQVQNWYTNLIEKDDISNDKYHKFLIKHMNVNTKEIGLYTRLFGNMYQIFNEEITSLVAFE